MDSKAIIGAVQGVTAKWTKQRKAEERHAAAHARRWEVMTYRRSITIKEAAYDVMEAAYMKASANNTLPAKARQVMYAARGKIQEQTGKSLDDRYFTQTLLPDFMAEKPSLTAGWKVVFDARGHLIEPHTKRTVPLGTLEVESYLRCLGEPRWSDPAASMPAIQTSGPSGRYGALLFCEKEGFNELFRAVQLGERYDLAIMSTKGVSVTAARHLVDQICARYQIPLFVLHDFDKSGFTILPTLQCDTRRYSFAHAINVIDLGLRLADVEKHGLESESVEYRESARSICATLAESGATEAEIAFLLRDRVELNAFTSDELIEWIERKLEEHGIRRVIPTDEVLAEGIGGSTSRPTSGSTSVSCWSGPVSTSTASRSCATCVSTSCGCCANSRSCRGTMPSLKLRTRPQTPTTAGEAKAEDAVGAGGGQPTRQGPGT